MPKRKKRSAEDGQSPDWTSLARAFSHPLRLRIYALLKDEPASPKDMSGRLGAPLSNTSYHVRVLLGHGLLEVVEKEQVRGSIKTTYRAKAPDLVDRKLWASLGAKIDELSVLADLEGALAKVAGALKAATAEKRPVHETRTIEVTLDEEGWSEVVAIADEVVERLGASEEKASRRSAETGAAPVPVLVTVLGFQAVP